MGDIHPLHLQHSSITVDQLVGSTCNEFVCVLDEDRVGVCFMRLDGHPHRFFLDAAVLFWSAEPDLPMPDEYWHFSWGDDWLEEEAIVDLGQALGVVGDRLSLVAMDETVLDIHFANGARLLLECRAGDDEPGGRVLLCYRAGGNPVSLDDLRQHPRVLRDFKG